MVFFGSYRHPREGGGIEPAVRASLEEDAETKRSDFISLCEQQKRLLFIVAAILLVPPKKETYELGFPTPSPLHF